jgi:hypothetical protein
MEYSPKTILGVPVSTPAPDPTRVVEAVVDMTDPAPKRRRPGARGSAAEDHRRVAVLVESGLGVGDAIRRVAADTGKARNTIQNNYYRTSRKLRGDAAPVARLAEPQASGEPAGLVLSSTETDAVAAEVVKGVKLLAAAAAAQAAEIAELRAKLDAVRRVTE